MKVCSGSLPVNFLVEHSVLVLHVHHHVVDVADLRQHLRGEKTREGKEKEEARGEGERWG